MGEFMIGIIGGSGLYEMEGFELTEEKRISTPFGDPSDAFMIGTLAGVKVAFLPRHGRGHVVSPSEINFRANIYGMKMLGVTKILSVSAVGSLRAEIEPGHFVIIDQFIDRTKARASTFFEDGVVAHVPFGDPICPVVAKQLHDSSKETGVVVHKGGTYVCMEGPAFSTRAESNMYRSFDASVIGMTNLQEAKLSREAEICYATIALSTDYDCWKEDEAHVDVSQVVKTVKQNVTNAQATLKHVVVNLSDGDCNCGSALKGAIMTAPKKVTFAAKDRLGILINKYV